MIDNCVFYNYDTTNKSNNISNSNSNNSKKYISKIVSYSPLLNNELTNVNTMKHRIPTYKSYFFVYADYHQLQKQELQDDFDEEENKLIYTKANEYLFKFENIQCIYLKDYLKSLSSSRKYIFQLIHFYKHLLEGIQGLVTINMVHGNIQLDKLVVTNNNKQEQVWLTDFRYSIDLSDENLKINVLSGLEQPVEFHFISYMLQHQKSGLSQYNIHTLVENIYDTYVKPLLKPLNNTELYSKMIDEAKEYYSKYANKSVKSIWSDMCQHFFTWDNYSLSIVYLKILIGLYTHVKIENNFLNQFIHLLVCNIHPNPYNRKTIEETLNTFDTIVYSTTSCCYKDLLKYI